MVATANAHVRLSVGTLLLTQDRAERMVADAVHDEADIAAAQLARKKERERRAVILAMLLIAGKRMAGSVQRALVRGRAQARIAARGRLEAELEAVGLSAAIIAALSRHAGAKRERLDDDKLHAQAAADSLASQWRTVAIAAALSAVARGRDPSDAIAGSARLVRTRSDRTAETEAGQAYNDEHFGALDDAVQADESFAAALEEARIMREWSALADACPSCAPLDGTRVGLPEPFPGGVEPGTMHPRCRCIAVLVSGMVP